MVAAKSLLAVVSLLLLIIGGPWATVEAATSSKTTPGITLSPFLQQLSIAPDDISRSFKLNITNNTEAAQELKLSAKDFGSLNETGGVLLEGSTNYSQKYGLASWLNLETDSLGLEPKASQVVTVTIDNHSSLRPGGHYGAIVASAESEANASGNQVAVKQQVLSLILLTKVGGEKYDLMLESIEHNGNWVRLPSTAKLRFRNPGNVHVVPRGLVKLRSPVGTVLAQGIINTESAYILPESKRDIYVPLRSVGRALPLPGVYQLQIEYRYDGIDRIAHKQFGVQFINLWFCLLVAIMTFGIWQIYRRRNASLKNPSSAK